MNKRVKHQAHIGLPLLELWNIYLEVNSTSMVRNFCIVYIEMAFDRLGPKVYASILSICHLDFCFVDLVTLGELLCYRVPDISSTGKGAHGSYGSGQYFGATFSASRYYFENCYEGELFFGYIWACCNILVLR